MIPTTSISEEVERLARDGRAAQALALLDSPAADRDPDALFTHAFWRISGRLVPRDLAAARDLFHRAALAGRPDAAQFHLALVASGAGGHPDWPAAMALLREIAKTDARAARQLAAIEDMNLTSSGNPVRLPAPDPLSRSPHAVCFRGLLTKAECSYLGDAAEPYLQPAGVIDPATGREIRNPLRTSESMGFGLLLEDPVIHAINRRLAAVSGTDVAQGEPLQILRYSQGQEYRAHLDALPAAGNQRVLTLLVYLNDDYDGGETRFLEAILDFRGGVGDALLFRNVLPDGRPDPASRHAGMPVKRGRKMIASRWIRARPIDLMKPLR